MKLLKAWNTFWFQPTSARPLGAFRILLGLIALLQVVILAFEVDLWLSDQGVLSGKDAQIIAGPYRLSPLQHFQDPITVRVFTAATGVVALCVMVGWHSRISSALLYLMTLSIYQRNVMTACGPDSLLTILLFYLMLSPSGAAFSLDARRLARKRGTVAEPLILPWSLRLIQIQLCFIYLDTAILKCSGASWLQGKALHYILHNQEFRRFNFEWLTQYPLIVNLMTHGAIAIELSLPVFLWIRPARKWVAFAGIALHTGIWFMLNVPLFGELMTLCYLTFLTPAEFDHLLHTLNPKTWFDSRQHPELIVASRVDAPSSYQGMHANPFNGGVYDDAMETEEIGAI